MNKSFSSNLSSNSDFTVRTGPSKLNCPLGHTASHDHYIQPVPPIYVTEYEDKFVWPKVDYNTSPSRFGSSKLLPSKSAAKYDSSVSARTSVESLDDIKEKDNQLSNAKYWDRMEESLKQLNAKGYDRTIATALSKHIKERDFVEGIDFAYNHFQKLLHHDEREGDDVRKMMLDFIHSVDIIKGYTTVQYDNLRKKNASSQVGDQRVPDPKTKESQVHAQPKEVVKKNGQPKAEWLNDKTIKVSLV